MSTEFNQVDMFGRQKLYQSPDITGYEDLLKTIMNSIADQILGSVSTVQEKLDLLSTPVSIILQYYVDKVCELLPSDCGLSRVDGNNLSPLLTQLISEKITLYSLQLNES